MARARLEQLCKEEWDLLIIGGGINGAGAARDAALRGLKVLLIDQADWASGTSSRSTKLVHGGLRYLEQAALGLVHEACRERRLLSTHLAPHLVRPQAFLIPIYQGDLRGPWQVRAGLWLYDLLASFRNVHNHRMISRAAALKLEPSLEPRGLRAAALYWDCSMNDARLVLENVLAAREAGASCLNYCPLRSVQSSGLGSIHVVLRDEEAGVEAAVRAKMLLNAAGPWADEVLGLAAPGALPLVRKAKGIHLITRPLTGERALLISAQQDGRVFFVIPWALEGRPASLVGTTDTDFSGDLGHLRAEEDEVNYLLAEASRVLPGAALKRKDVWATYAGVRPLAALGADPAHPSSHSREALLRWDGGVLSMSGGKFTTYRSLCAKAVDACVSALGAKPAPCLTAKLPLPGAPEQGVEALASSLAQAHSLPPGTALHLAQTYGRSAQALLEAGRRHQGLLGPVDPSLPAILAQADWACLQEDARHLADFYLRRSFLGLVLAPDHPGVLKVAEVMARCLGWGEERLMQEVADLRKVVAGEYR
jgi:glycerol-3-phosphate dehydrogenase